MCVWIVRIGDLERGRKGVRDPRAFVMWVPATVRSAMLMLNVELIAVEGRKSPRHRERDGGARRRRLSERARTSDRRAVSALAWTLQLG